MIYSPHDGDTLSFPQSLNVKLRIVTLYDDLYRNWIIFCCCKEKLISISFPVHKTAFIPKRKWKCVRIKTKQKVSDAEMSWKN